MYFSLFLLFLRFYASHINLIVLLIYICFFLNNYIGHFLSLGQFIFSCLNGLHVCFAVVLICHLIIQEQYLFDYYRLTSFVVRSFVSAQPYIYIDDHVVREATDWIIRKQKRYGSEGGSFRETGRVINAAMQGGVAGRPDALTAYVITTLCQVKHTVSLCMYMHI